MAQNYIIDHKEEIIKISFIGENDKGDVMATLLEIIDDSKYKSHYNILTDLSDCSLSFNLTDLTEFSQLFEVKFSDSTGRSAIVINTPRETALAMLHRKNVEKTRKIRVFSTRKAALSWLRSE